MLLDGKVAIITGASSGIGAAAAELFAANGASLVLGARRQDRLEALAAGIRARGGAAVALAGDVREERYAAALVETAEARFAGLDIALNNAGTLGPMLPLPAMTTADWTTTIDTNLTAAFHAARCQLPAMHRRGGGSLVFTSSFVGHTIGFADMAAYGASKAALIGLAKCLAVEHGRAGIRVNALLPGGTRTAMSGDFSADPAATAVVAGFHALKRMAEPAEIAHAALFLASDAASFVTGTAMLADGGNSVTKA